MKAVLLVFFSLALASAGAQDSDTWTMQANNKILARGTTNNEEAVVKLHSAAIAKLTGAHFILQYRQAQGCKGWNRTFDITNAADKSLQTATLPSVSGSVSFSTLLLKKNAAAKTPLFIYTISLPVDKEKAAAVRVRRILLCKIEWL